MSKKGELLKKSPEAKLDEKLQKKCRSQIMKEFPAEQFFVPKDK